MAVPAVQLAVSCSAGLESDARAGQQIVTQMARLDPQLNRYYFAAVPEVFIECLFANSFY